MEYPRCFGGHLDAIFSLAFIPKLNLKKLTITITIKAKSQTHLFNVFGFLTLSIFKVYDTFLRFLGLTKVKFKKCSNESSRMSNQGSGNSGDSVPVKVEL